MTTTSNATVAAYLPATMTKDTATVPSSSLPASKLVPTAFPLPKDATSVTIPSNDRLFPVLASYIVSNPSSGAHSSLSYKARQTKESAGGCYDSDDDSCCGETCATSAVAAAGAEGTPPLLVDAELGVGIHRFRDDRSGGEFIAVMQQIGEPVGTGCGAEVLRNLVLCAPNTNSNCDEHALRRLVSRVWEESQAEKGGGYFRVFRFDPSHHYWSQSSTIKARPMDSVIIPKETKDKLVDDISDFLSEDTQRYYAKHGIPYRRSYLLHGVPGSGKTSLIQAIAGAYGRSLAFLQPLHPEMTDDVLRSAMQDLPRRSLVVIEDIDALFGGDRAKKAPQCPLTFSGLLNALDGVGSADGQLVFLTTNFRARLDAALVRAGRVDAHVRFGPATEEQCRAYFARFYGPAARAGEAEEEKKEEDGTALSGCEGDLAARFGRAVAACLEREGRDVSTAALQHFFVTHRKCTAEEALAAVGDIVAEAKMREEEEEAEKKGKAEGEGSDDAASGDEATGDGSDDANLGHSTTKLDLRRGTLETIAAIGFGAALAAVLLRIGSGRGK